MNWFWKWLGYHVCEEFTQWEEGTHYATIIPLMNGLPVPSLKQTVSRTIQSRRCTICGKVYVRGIK